MKTTEITSSIQLAARLTDSLYRDGIINSDSAQALFDILADALDKRPDVVLAVSADLQERQSEQRLFYSNIMNRLDAIEQESLRWYTNKLEKDTNGVHYTSLKRAAELPVTGGSNED